MEEEDIRKINEMYYGQCENGGEFTFNFIDYSVLGIMLLVSCAIGIFYGFFSSKQETSGDFLLGGSSMKTFPMSLSLAASFITAIELLGNPAEMYFYGSQFWTICFAFLIVIPITSTFYLPVYMKLRLTSAFEYLEMRFNKSVMLLASAMYAIQMTLYTAVAVYAPALALSHVTGMGVYYAVTVVYIVCIFYSSQGGMKAVIMTDTFQSTVLMLSLFAIVILGTIIAGGFSNIIDNVYESGRIQLFKLDVSPTERHTLWSLIIGGVFYWVPMFSSNQASIQKYLSVKTIDQVRIALWVSAFSLILIYTINFYTGMILFSEYYKCDPLTEGKVKKPDEILPYYVMHVLSAYKGLPGFFVAGIFASSLGTVASALNSLAAITIQDFIKTVLKIEIPDSKGATVSKWLSIGFGALSFLLVFIVERVNSVLKAAITFNGLVGGITLALFSLGMFLPWTNSKGAFVGAVTAFAVLSWIGIGTQIAEQEGYVSEEYKPMFDFNCTCFRDESNSGNDSNSDVFVIYRISYMWYSAIGFFITFIIGYLVSYITGLNDPSTVHDDLISPPFKKLFDSLPIGMKQTLNIPITNKPSKNGHKIEHEIDLKLLKQSHTEDYVC